MKKADILADNSVAIEKWNRAIDELPLHHDERRLHYCQAWVTETQHFYILRSYQHLIACIEKSTDTLVDMLRFEYGYTSTSNQHICKFSKAYGNGKWGAENRLTWRPVDIDLAD